MFVEFLNHLYKFIVDLRPFDVVRSDNMLFLIQDAYNNSDFEKITELNDVYRIYRGKEERVYNTLTGQRDILTHYVDESDKITREFYGFVENPATEKYETITYKEFCDSYKTPETLINQKTYDRYDNAMPNNRKTAKQRAKIEKIKKDAQENVNEIYDKLAIETEPKGNIFQRYNHFNFGKQDVKMAIELKTHHNALIEKVSEALKIPEEFALNHGHKEFTVIPDEKKKHYIEQNPLFVLRKLMWYNSVKNKEDKSKRIDKELYMYFKRERYNQLVPHLDKKMMISVLDWAKAFNPKKYTDEFKEELLKEPVYKTFNKTFKNKKSMTTSDEIVQKGGVTLSENIPTVKEKFYEFFDEITDEIRETYNFKIEHDIYLFLKFYDFQPDGDVLKLYIDLKNRQVVPNPAEGDYVKEYEFVPIESKSEKIEEMIKSTNQDNLQNNYGLNSTKLYYNICDKYVGIREQDVKDYLNTKTAYRIRTEYTRTVNSPVLAKRPNYKWAIDLIDVGHYHIQGFRYILSVIDVFSKKCWIGVLRHFKSAEEMRNAFIAICIRACVFPQIIMCDNGSEFKAAMKNWCRNKKNPILRSAQAKRNLEDTKIYIKLSNSDVYVEKPPILIVNTLSYTPQSNGLVENLNKFIRKLMRDTIVRVAGTPDAHKWPHKNGNMRNIEDTKNNMVNSVTKFSPNQIWTPLPFI
jgi:hypothetical protein